MNDESSNTAPEQRKVPGVPFVKGDKRINRNGRPRSFDALRKLAIKIAGELADEEEITRITKMMRDMSRSSNPSDRALFLAYAYGKPKENIDITSKGEKIKAYIEFSPADWDNDEQDKPDSSVPPPSVAISPAEG